MLRRRTLWPTRRRFQWSSRRRFRWPVMPSNILIAPTYPTLTLPTDCGCCPAPTCPGCPFRDPMPCTLNVLISATGNLSLYDGCSAPAVQPTGLLGSPYWQFNPRACNGGANPCGPAVGPPAWNTRFICGTLGGVPCLSLRGDDPSSPGFGQVYWCFGSYVVDGSTNQSVTSITYTPFHEVLFIDFGAGTTVTLDITE